MPGEYNEEYDQHQTPVKCILTYWTFCIQLKRIISCIQSGTTLDVRAPSWSQYGCY